MANSLLDFVMSLVRDPDAAARYAADPQGAIADAHLTDVTSVDVTNLIPMVSDSLSMAAPAVGGDHAADGNVWASGAATAAFDAFDTHITDPLLPDVHGVQTDLIDQTVHAGQDFAADVHPSDFPAIDPSTQFTEPVADHVPADDGGFGLDDHVGWDHPVIDNHGLDADHSGFDIFE
jgi:hypothetical protein